MSSQTSGALSRGASFFSVGISLALLFVGSIQAAPIVTYNEVNGQLTVDTTDGTLLSSLFVEGPPAMSIDRWSDGRGQICKPV